MKTINYEEWKSRRSERTRAWMAVANANPERAVGRRPRDPEKDRILTRMIQARIAKNIESGKLEILGPRHLKWHIKQGLGTTEGIDS